MMKQINVKFIIPVLAVLFILVLLSTTFSPLAPLPVNAQQKNRPNRQLVFNEFNKTYIELYAGNEQVKSVKLDEWFIVLGSEMPESGRVEDAPKHYLSDLLGNDSIILNPKDKENNRVVINIEETPLKDLINWEGDAFYLFQNYTIPGSPIYQLVKDDDVEFGLMGTVPAPAEVGVIARLEDRYGGKNPEGRNWNWYPKDSFGKENPKYSTTINAPLAEDSLYINEIYLGTNPYIELYNPTDTAINVFGYFFLADYPVYIEENAIIEPYGYYVFDDPKISQLGLNATADNLYLFDNYGRRIDQVGWEFDAGSDFAANSIQRTPDGGGSKTGYDRETSKLILFPQSKGTANPALDITGVFVTPEIVNREPTTTVNITVSLMINSTQNIDRIEVNGSLPYDAFNGKYLSEIIYYNENGTERTDFDPYTFSTVLEDLTGYNVYNITFTLRPDTTQSFKINMYLNNEFLIKVQSAAFTVNEPSFKVLIRDKPTLVLDEQWTYRAIAGEPFDVKLIIENVGTYIARNTTVSISVQSDSGLTLVTGDESYEHPYELKPIDEIDNILNKNRGSLLNSSYGIFLNYKFVGTKPIHDDPVTQEIDLPERYATINITITAANADPYTFQLKVQIYESWNVLKWSNIYAYFAWGFLFLLYAFLIFYAPIKRKFKKKQQF